MEGLCEYEQQRLAHIRRNHEMLVRLGLVDADSKPIFCAQSGSAAKGKMIAKGPTKQRTKLPAVPPESLRRSSRTRGDNPEYGPEVVDSYGDEDEEVSGKKRKLDPERNGNGAKDDEAAVQADMLEAATEFLRAAREALLQFVSSADGEAPATAEGWHAEAVQRWGPQVGGETGDERDWETYVSSRLSKPPPTSSLDLLQEYYAADTWQLLCCCVLMTRCSSWATKHRCISGFFEAFPTPSAFLSKVVLAGETVDLKPIIHSLGLFDDRLKSLVNVTRAFLFGDDAFEVGLEGEHLMATDGL